MREARHGHAGGDVEVLPVVDRAGLKQFIELPFALYADDPAWVPPLRAERRMHLSPRHNPFFEHGEGQLFLARRAGRVVGRISAQVNRLYHAQHPDEPRTGFFGFLEGEDNPAVFRALLDAAAGWLRARGMERMQGPFSWSINQESGLLVAGFDTPPAMMMNHARPWYDAHVQAAGLRKAMDLLAYDYRPEMGVPEKVWQFIARLQEKGELQVRPLNRRRLREELDLIMDIFNDAWADNWGFIPFTPEDINHMAQQLRFFIRDHDVAIASWKGEPAAMAVVMPDLNRLIADFDGRLLPFNWARLLWRLKVSRAPKRWRMPLMGVRRKFHGHATAGILAMAVLEAVHAVHRQEGYAGAELSWVLESNVRTRRIIEDTGAVPYKTYRIYERTID